MRLLFCSVLPAAVATMLAAASPRAALADKMLYREPPEGSLRIGQRILVDDGTCPAGMIKEITGRGTGSKAVQGQMAQGQQPGTRARKCVKK